MSNYFKFIKVKCLFLGGAGEIIVWDLPSSEVLWKLKLGKVLISDIVWLTNDILLASLTTGIILKCDTTE